MVPGVCLARTQRCRQPGDYKQLIPEGVEPWELIRFPPSIIPLAGP